VSEIILIQVTGEDAPGLTADLMPILSGHDVNILDIGQAVIHRMLTLGILIEIPQRNVHAPVLKDLLFHLHGRGLQVRFTPITAEEYANWVGRGGKAYYSISLLGRVITADHIARVAAVASANQLNIDRIARLSRRTHPGARHRACIELTVCGEVEDTGEMHRAFLEISREVGVDIAFQRDDLFRRHRRLVVFDMDSTLIQQEVIDELAAAGGVGDQVAAITAAAMRGELDFKQSLQQRLRLLAGLDAAVLPEIAARLRFTEGLERLFTHLRVLGLKTAIVSGGFSYFAQQLQRRLGMDYAFANELEIADGKLTGRIQGEIIDGERKAQLLATIARQENIRLEQVIAVGDGANDLPMLRLSGLGIAFHAKPTVQEEARQSISSLGLDSILYLIGVRDHDALA
jgi:phosphoserine phosphatase